MNELLVEFLRAYTTDNDWSVISIEISLAILALGLLFLEMILPKDKLNYIPRFAIWGQTIILVALLGFSGFDRPVEGSYFSGLILQSDVTQIMRIFFLSCSILVCYLGKIYLSKQSLPKTEFFTLILIISAAMMLLTQSAHFVMLFVALETVTVAFYVLVAYCRTSQLSLESGLKYLILGALSSGILLFGIVLLYGIAGSSELTASSGDSLNYSALSDFIINNSNNLIVNIGALLVVAGICFKIGAVPFQIWIPDVYQGAPTPVTAYLAVASKAAGFVVLMQLIRGPFVGISTLIIPILSVIAIASVIFGNVAAIKQHNVKRLMGLSGIAHAGYLLVGAIASIYLPWAVYAVIFYLATYLFASFAVFGVMSFLENTNDAVQELDHYHDIAKEQPFLSGVLTFGLGSLAGIPPLGGFVAKLFLFVAAFQAGLYSLLVVSVFGVVISIYYYFAWIRRCYFSTHSVDLENCLPLPLSRADTFLLGSLIFATLALGIFPALLPIIP